MPDFASAVSQSEQFNAIEKSNFESVERCVPVPIRLSYRQFRELAEAHRCHVERAMLPVYLFGGPEYGVEAFKQKPAFSFTYHRGDVQAKSIIVWIPSDSSTVALLAKIKRTRHSTTIGLNIEIVDAMEIRVFESGLLSALESLSHHVFEPEFTPSRFILLPPADAEQVKRIVLKNNQDVPSDYFETWQEPDTSTLAFELREALATGLSIFGFDRKQLPSLTEAQVLDWELGVFAKQEGGNRESLMPTGGFVLERGGRQLRLHKVHQTAIEKCLGVDLIYQEVQERRLVFVQYKCPKKGEKAYYHRNDKNHDSELERMMALPGIGECLNHSHSLGECRLCRCSAFFKLCKREIAEGQELPHGVYYPACVWKHHVSANPGIKLSLSHHFNNESFRHLFRGGMIGSTPAQFQQLMEALPIKTNNDRISVIFEEFYVK